MLFFIIGVSYIISLWFYALETEICIPQKFFENDNNHLSTDLIDTNLSQLGWVEGLRPNVRIRDGAYGGKCPPWGSF